MKWSHSKSDVPTEQHFAIVVFSSIYIPGDRRSEECPGHGYPAHSESQCEYIVFKSEEEWKADIKKRMESKYGSDDFMPIRAIPARVKTNIEIQ